jgi:hypothetical protein
LLLGPEPMERWAILAIAIYTLANTSVVHLQRFIMRQARQASDELGGGDRRQVRALQNMMTPFVLPSLAFLCYFLLALSFVWGFRAWGWLGAGLILIWGVFTAVFVERGWPFPTPGMCARIAAAEVRRRGKLPHLEPDERELVTKILLKRLEAAAESVTP